MRLQRRVIGTVAVVVAMVLSVPLAAVSVSAQDLPLAQVLPDLVLKDIVLQRGSVGPPHQAHFSPLDPLVNDVNNPVVAIVESFNTQMATQFSTFPLGSSTGGLTYVFDTSVGTFQRGSASFGPLFAERALTIGRRKLSAGFNYQRTSYSTFEGQHLDDGSVKFYLRHQDCCGWVDPATFSGFFSNMPSGSRLAPPFEGDLIEAALSLKATTHTAAVFANYGLTDRWDIGLAVPIVRVNLDASVNARIIRLVTAPPPDAQISAEDRLIALNVHTFEANNPDATRTVRHSGNATGLGDIVLRSKYHFLQAAGGGLAVAVDVRLPTGDKDNLLGVGAAQAKVFLVLSDERGRFGHHVNAGYTVSRGDVAGTVTARRAASVPDEFDYAGGMEFVATPRLTLVGDMIGRTLRGAGRLELATKQFEYNDPGLNSMGLPGPGCGGVGGPTGGFTCRTASFDEFDSRSGNLTLLLGTGGAKFNLTGNLLVTGSLLFPLTNAGLRSRMTMVVGLDYAF